VGEHAVGAEHHLLDVGGAGEHEHDNLGGAGYLGDAGGGRAAGGGQLAG
jgi:hypothetical protein